MLCYFKVLLVELARVKLLNYYKALIWHYFLQKWLCIEETLMKLDICFFEKRWWVIRKIKWNLEKSK